MTVHVFGPDRELYPRPIEEIVKDLQQFPNFEKVLCYQFPGLMNAPWASRQPGGAATVRLYRDFQQFFKTGHVE